MRVFSIALFIVGALTSCVPAKKYQELLERERHCQDELNKYRASALSNEDRSKDLEASLNLFRAESQRLARDTARLGEQYRNLQTQYDKMVLQNLAYEKRLEQERQAGSKEAGTLQADLESRSLELQRKSDALMTLENDLKLKQSLLDERERRIAELEEMIQRKDDALRLLKQKVSAALKGFENKGLTVVEKNGKLYVSMEAKLLFASGSTTVESEGRRAIIELAKVLEKEKDLEIIVEGHTDTDKLQSSNHPKSNWELSVLRATAVVEIMTGNSFLSPAQLAASGRSEFHPIDAKDKAKNRRIEIIISPNLNALFELISKP